MAYGKWSELRYGLEGQLEDHDGEASVGRLAFWSATSTALTISKPRCRPRFAREPIFSSAPN
jgi:hypothetical protein